MPNISTFNAPIPSVSIPNSGAQAHVAAGRVEHLFFDQAGAQAGGAISEIGNQIGKRIDDANDMHDLAAGSLEMMQTEQALAKEHENLLKASVAPDPENATPDQVDDVRRARQDAQTKLDSFLEDRAIPAMQTVAEKYGNSDRTRLHMSNSMIEYTKGMGRQFAADRANVAGQEVISNLDSIKNQGINAALSDPEKADLYRGQFLQAVKSMTDGNRFLTAEQSAKITDHYTEVANQGFATAVVQGYMNKSQGQDGRGEDIARKVLDSGKLDQYLAPGEKERLTKEVEEHQKTREADFDHKTRQASQDAVDRLTSQIYDAKSGRVDYQIASQMVGKARTDPGILQKDRNKVGSFVAQAVAAQRSADANEELSVHDDPATVLNLMKGIISGTTTLDAIGKAATDKKITVPRMMELANSLQKPSVDALKKLDEDPVVKAQFGLADNLIQGNLANPNDFNSVVKGRQNQYRIDVLQKMRDAMVNGQDPRQFLDPKSKAYIDPMLYKPTTDEIANEVVLRPIPGAGTAAPTKRPPLGSFFNFGGQ